MKCILFILNITTWVCKCNDWMYTKKDRVLTHTEVAFVTTQESKRLHDAFPPLPLSPSFLFLVTMSNRTEPNLSIMVGYIALWVLYQSELL